jgi:phosphatidylserine decarboxylase
MILFDSLLTSIQHVAPQRRLSSMVWSITRIEHKALKNALIRIFRLFYFVDMSEAARGDIADYKSFNDFFTRELLPESRPTPTNERAVLSPADGAISQIGQIQNGRLIQAKGRDYSLQALLADDIRLSQKFDNGHFATIYLAPHNYHRVHSPVSGSIEKVRYVPGKLFSVNNRTARCVDNLFARNERTIVELSTAIGSVTVVLVGAMLVASMDIIGCELATEIRRNSRNDEPFDVPIKTEFSEIREGDELGRFNMGSTVIILLEPGRVSWNPALRHAIEVRVRQSIGSRLE